jgi:polyhydroxyalkanoate synthesis regulator phasin
MSSKLISKAILSGIGFASLTKDAIHKTAEDLVNQSKLSEEEGRRLVKEFQRRSAHAQKTFENRVTAAVHKALQSVDLTAIDGRKKSSKASRRTTKRARGSAAATSRQ